MPEGSQTHFRSIVTDRFMRALGSDGTIIALGDGATVEQVNDLLYSSHSHNRLDHLIAMPAYSCPSRLPRASSCVHSNSR